MAYIERDNGKFLFSSEDADEDLQDETFIREEDVDLTRLLPLPDKRALNLGKRLALDFAENCLPENYDEVERIFARRGAYSRFRTLLERQGALQKWYGFEAKAEETAVRKWAAENDIEIVGCAACQI